jgi:hypothetical protein
MKRLLSGISVLAVAAASVAAPAYACTRALYVGDGNLVLTGRNMDWKEDMSSNLWVLPAGMKRNGAAGAQSAEWTSKYGGVVVSGYEAGSTDGMNEKGLVANLLYLAESQYPKPVQGKPYISLSTWLQYALDNFATVGEAVEALRAEPFNVLAPALPNGAPSTLHLSLSDASGDSAILEYVNGKLVIHHGKQYAVMTNSPIYSEQLALNAYWESIGGDLPPRHQPRRRPLRPCLLPAGRNPPGEGPQLHKGRARAVLHVSGGGQRDERDARRQRPVGHHHAGSAEHFLDDLADRLGPEEPHLLFRLGDPSQHVLGVVREARLQARRTREEAHHPEWRGLFG